MSKGMVVVGVLLLAVVGVFFWYSLDVLDQSSVQRTTVDDMAWQGRLWQVPDFELDNCDGRRIKRADMLGKVWIAAFIFTRCPGPCPVITQRMAEIQNSLEGTPGFRLASFSIDPTYDTPEVLLEYAEGWKADLQRWLFLTSEDAETMREVTQAFKVAAVREEDSEGSDIPNITHGTNLLLVGPEGYVRTLFSTEDPNVTERAIGAVRGLLAAEM